MPFTTEREVRFAPAFDTTMHSISNEHWMVLVTKMTLEEAFQDRGLAVQGKKATPQSTTATNIVSLNQTQNTLKPMRRDQAQFTSAHEYGHMLNLWNDEYEAASAHRGDADSIMHSGNLVRARHLARFRTWGASQIERVERREREAARRRVAELEAFRNRAHRRNVAPRDAYRHLDERQRRRLDG